MDVGFTGEGQPDAVLEQPVTEVGGIPTPVQMTVEAIVSAAERGDTAALVDLADAEKLGFF